MCKALSECHGPTLLLTLEGSGQDVQTTNVSQLTFKSNELNVLRRANAFMHWVNEILNEQNNLVVGHFRDIWGGIAVLQHPHIFPLFEVNGLPSIEMPNRFPHLGGETLHKLRQLEDHCLKYAQCVITPSETIRQHLIHRGTSAEKINVITNGADLVPVMEPCEHLRGRQYMVYIGALQPWQGVDILLRSLRYFEDKTDVQLVICSAHSEHQSKPYRKFAEKLGVHERIHWLYQLPKDQLQQVVQHALFSVAPLTECSRNLEQGCSPLKVFESMACGVPVIASDLPVTREIITAEVDGKLFRPGRPADLARCMRLLIDYPDHRKKLGTEARNTIEKKFTWHAIERQLAQLYDDLLIYSFQ